MSAIRRASEALILPLAVASFIIGVVEGYGVGFMVGFMVGGVVTILALAHVKRAERKRAEWRWRAIVKQSAWQALERRPR